MQGPSGALRACWAPGMIDRPGENDFVAGTSAELATPFSCCDAARRGGSTGLTGSPVIILFLSAPSSPRNKATGFLSRRIKAVAGGGEKRASPSAGSWNLIRDAPFLLASSFINLPDASPRLAGFFPLCGTRLVSLDGSRIRITRGNVA